MNTETEQWLLHHARNGNNEEVRQLLETMERNEVIADIHCKGNRSKCILYAQSHMNYLGDGVLQDPGPH
uniref:Uncharacterized protein n=2 Tax=Equus TaxID=9789 RepID=A0A9L0RZ14_HORSE